METLFHLLPQELICIISNNLYYEDIKSVVNLLVFPNSLQEVLLKRILKYIKIIKCRNKYKIYDADRYKLSDFSRNIKYIDKNILISIDKPSDFEELLNYKSLVNASFILPVNDYEYYKEYNSYLNAFYDVYFIRKDAQFLNYNIIPIKFSL
jgi:hypothetical protein